MSAYHPAGGKHSSCGALHNENTVVCESDAEKTDADVTGADVAEVGISWTLEVEV